MDESKLRQLSNVVGFSLIFSQFDSKALTGILNDILYSFKKSGANTVYNEAKAVLSPKLRETAMCFAIRIACADERMEKSERDFIAYLAAEFEVSMDVFEAMTAVLAIMQRPATE